MLDGLRIISKNPFGRAILALFAGLIVVGFGFFGIRDVFTNFRADQLATVGDQTISAIQYRNEYQNELQRLQRQARRAVTNQEARAAGLDRQVLARMLTGAVLDQDAERLGLSLSDAEVARTVKAEKVFAGADGKFDQARFDMILRDNGYSESSFLHEERAGALRQLIGAAVTGDFKVPTLMLEAINRFNSETRKADYFILPADAGALPAPSDQQIKDFYELRKDGYRKPEYRKVTTLTLSVGALAKNIAVSDDAVKAAYDRDAAQYALPEHRKVAQLTFQTREAADKAKSRIDSGESFAAVAADKQAGGVLADLGETVKATIFDTAVADAAFQAPSPGVAGPVQGKFGYVLVDVSQITPGKVQAFDSVKETIRQELAERQAKAELQTKHDQIEDLRSSGKTLAQAAKELGLQTQDYVTDASGAGKDGPIPALAAAPELLKAIFASDVGVDNDSVSRKDGGVSWFEIDAIEPSRQQPLAEVKDQVAQALKISDAQKALAKKANELAQKIDGGADLAELARANGASAQQATDARRAGGAGLSEAAVAEIFSLPVGAAGVALADKNGRYVLKVTASATPPLDPNSPALASALPQLESAMADDLLTQYVGGLESQLGVKINQAALRAALGSEQ